GEPAVRGTGTATLWRDVLARADPQPGGGRARRGARGVWSGARRARLARKRDGRARRTSAAAGLFRALLHRARLRLPRAARWRAWHVPGRPSCVGGATGPRRRLPLRLRVALRGRVGV